jgi:hypothetical protein
MFRADNPRGCERNKSRSKAGSNREGDAGGTNRRVGEVISKAGQIRHFLGITAFQCAVTQQTVVDDYLQLLYLMFELQ